MFIFCEKKTTKNKIFWEKIPVKYSSNGSSCFYLTKMLEKAYRFLDLAMWHVYLGKWYKITEVFNCESHE